jgi:hypothetical protein
MQAGRVYAADKIRLKQKITMLVRGLAKSGRGLRVLRDAFARIVGGW